MAKRRTAGYSVRMHELVCHIDTAYRWLCHRRREYPAGADVWDLRFHWSAERRCILDDL